MIAEARRLEHVFPIVGSIFEKWANYTVGSCRAAWATGEPDIDQTYQDGWLRWMDIADARGIHHFQQLTQLAVKGWKCDGDCFGQFGQEQGFMQVAAIEADRVLSNPGSGLSMDSEFMRGGISINKAGQPTSYRVCDRQWFGFFRDPVDVPAADICHLYKPSRIDAYRGVTSLHSVINFIADVKQIIDDEKTAVAINSRLAMIIKNVIGRAPAEVNLFADNSTTANAPDVQEIAAGVMQYIFTQESVEAHHSDRPSQTWQGFMQFLLQLIAIGSGLPYGVIWSMAGLSGPAVRFDIQSASRAFKNDQKIIIRRWLRRICGRWISREIAAGRLPFHENWYNFTFPTTDFISIDLGRDSKAAIEEHKMGLMTATRWYEDDEQSAYQQYRILAQEAKWRKELAAEFDIEPTEIRFMQNQPQLPNQEAEKPAGNQQPEDK